MYGHVKYGPDWAGTGCDYLGVWINSAQGEKLELGRDSSIPFLSSSGIYIMSELEIATCSGSSTVILQPEHRQSQLYWGCILGNNITKHEEAKPRQFFTASRPVKSNIYIPKDTELYPVRADCHSWAVRWIQYAVWSFPHPASTLQTLLWFRNPIMSQTLREEVDDTVHISFPAAECTDTAASCRCIRNSTEAY